MCCKIVFYCFRAGLWDAPDESFKRLSHTEQRVAFPHICWRVCDRLFPQTGSFCSKPPWSLA